MGGVRIFGIPFQYLRHRWALRRFNRNVRNPQFLLSSEPGPRIHIMVNQKYLSAPLVGRAFLTHPFAIYDGHKISSVNRLGLYRLGRFHLQVAGRVLGREIRPSDADSQKDVFLISSAKSSGQSTGQSSGHENEVVDMA